MSRTIHSVSLCGALLTLWATACMQSRAQAAGSPDAGTVSDQTSLSLAPSASGSSSQRPETDAALSSSVLPPVEDSLRLDALPPVDSNEADKWKDYPDRWWLKTPGSILLPQVNGHVGIKRASFSKNVPVDLSLSDLTKSLQYAVGLSVEGGHGPYFGGFQGNWAHWKKNDITGPLGVTNIDVQADYGLLNGYLGYHFLDIPLGYNLLGLDAVAGTYWTYSRLRISPARISSAQRTVSWFDPYVGLRGQIYLTQNIDVQAQGDVGGFDADNDKFFWMGSVLVEYRFTPKWSVTVGYQAISQDYSTDTFDWKLITHGPTIGLTSRW